MILLFPARNLNRMFWPALWKALRSTVHVVEEMGIFHDSVVPCS